VASVLDVAVMTDTLRRELMIFGIDAIAIGPGASSGDWLTELCGFAWFCA
jgi:hypothetical protein